MLGLLTFLSINFVYAADGIITGKITDSKTKAPLEYVTVTVKKLSSAADSATAPVKGTLTDKTGSFIFKNISDGNYLLSISFVGYKTFEQNISLTSDAKLPDLKISLLEESEVLEKVEISGIRSQMKIDIDKKVFNVDQNIASSGGNASDVLSNIPSVEVDNEGEVSLRGNAAVTIWINGKASGLSADNRAQILEQLPAENIEKIEVITNPSAKYSPEGTAGIINIVLKQNRKAGYFGSVQAGIDIYGKYNASANINYSNSKLETYASLGYRERKHRGGGNSYRLNISDTDTTFLDQHTNTTGDRHNLFGRLGLTWHLTTKDHFTLNGFGMFGGGMNSSTINYTSDIPDSYLQSTRLTNADNDMVGGNFELGYKHDFSERSNIDFTASYNKWGMKNSSVFEQTSIYENNRTTSSYQKQTGDIGPHNWDFQLDYTNSFNDNNKIEAGYKGTLGRESSPVETYSGTNRDNAVPTTELFNEFIYNQDIHALYSTYSGRLSDFGYQLGLRGEYSNINTRSLGYNQTKSDVLPYKNDYLSLFPSVFISYSLPKDNELQVNYTRRITRPRGRELNSFKNITDSTNISFGNPYLSPEFSNAFELNYIKSWQNHILSFSGYYHSTDGVIQRIRFIDDNIMKTTFENITRTSSTGAEIVLKNRLFKILDLTTTVNLFHYKLDGFSYLPENTTVPVIGTAQEDFSWKAKLIASFVLPKSLSIQITGDYNAKQPIAQGYRKANYSLDAGIRKTFSNIISVSISGRDLLDSRRRHSVTSGMGFIQDSENWREGRQASLTVTYNFGNTRPKRQDRKQGAEQESNGGYDMEGDF
ncbi:MAG: TonB-dependent receptor [Prevotellaceae bacterium]|nr:TonB-dependent receptor [Prevotellaceae bacterium]